MASKIIRHSRLDGVSAVVWTCTHPIPSRGKERAISHAKRLARLEAVGSMNRAVWFTAVDDEECTVYDSRADDEINDLISRFPIRKDRAYIVTQF